MMYKFFYSMYYIFFISLLLIAQATEPILYSDEEKIFHELLVNKINDLRSSDYKNKNGVGFPKTEITVKWNDTLGIIAHNHALDLAKNKPNTTDYHTGSDGSSIRQRVERANYVYEFCGENVLKGFNRFEDGFEWWKNSNIHLKNLTDPRFTEIGFAHIGQYRVLVFGKPKYPRPSLKPSQAFIP